jgi:hypothetical protein
MVGTTQATPKQQEFDFDNVSGVSQSPAPQGNAANPTDAKTQTPPKAPDPNAPKQEEQESGGYGGSQFLGKKTADVLKETFGIKTLDPHLEEMLKKSKPRKTKDGVAIDLEDGNTILAGNKSIGLVKGQEMKPEAAKAIIELAKSRGWDDLNINPYATPAEKDMLWLEAQRHGLKIANYAPEENSKTFQDWEREKLGEQKISQATDEDKIHMDTLRLLRDRANAEKDPVMKAGLEKMFKGVEDMSIPTSAATLAALGEALSDKHPGREGFNLAVDALKKGKPDLDIAKIDEPAGTGQPVRPPNPKTATNAARI